MLTYLIRNAVSASRERKTPVVVTLGQVGETLRLAVRDNGVGIAAEHLERIFEPGFTTQAFGSGSGEAYPPSNVRVHCTWPPSGLAGPPGETWPSWLADLALRARG